MRSLVVLGLIGILLVGAIGSIIPAMGQALPFIADYVVINEVEINPVGDDYQSISEWVELYNPTDGPVHIGNWKIASNNALKQTLTIPSGTIIDSRHFIIFSHERGWFSDVTAVIQLINEQGEVVDQTPEITDTQNDNLTWQRIYDGHDTNASDDWRLARTTVAGLNAAVPTIIEDEKVGLSVSTDQTNYLWGQTALIGGGVSERVYTKLPIFYPTPINVRIIGPAGFDQSRTLYPDLNLRYTTDLVLSPIQEMTEGTYDVTVEYAGTTASTQFTIGTPSVFVEEVVTGEILISTDKPVYIPGENVVLTGTVPESIPFEGMNYIVRDADGIQFVEGNLFPKEIGAGVYGAKGGAFLVDPDRQFTTFIFIDTNKPVFGIYTIDAEYAGKSAQIVFQVVEDVREDRPISLATDKRAYRPGDTVTVSGRLNEVFDYTINLSVIQTNQKALGVTSKVGFIYPGGQNLFQIRHAIPRLEGDFTFSHTFTIPNNPNQLGDYKVEAWSVVGRETTLFTVVENPDEFEAQTEPISLNTYKIPRGERRPSLNEETIFETGDTVLLRGQVTDITRRSSFETPTVQLSITNEAGQSPEITTRAARDIGPRAKSAFYTFTAVPDIGGNFAVPVPLAGTHFRDGTYKITANYNNGQHITSTLVDIIEIVGIGDSNVVASLDKSVYAPGEEIHLTGYHRATAQGSLPIIIIWPSGNTENSGTSIDNGEFSWSWTTPTGETSVRKLDTTREPIYHSNFGFYQLLIRAESETTRLVFEVNPNPEEVELLGTERITVFTDKPEYEPGDILFVYGDVIKKQQGLPSRQGLVVPERAHITISRQEVDTLARDCGTSICFNQVGVVTASVVPDIGGHYRMVLDAPITSGLWEPGTYKVSTQYESSFGETTFQINNPARLGVGTDVPVFVDAKTDKEQYRPGETVLIFGKPSKVVWFDNVRISVIKGDETRLLCQTTFCKFQSGQISNIRPYENGIFTYEYKIPDTFESLGPYKIITDGGFRVPTELFFFVTAAPDVELEPDVSRRATTPSPSDVQRILPDQLVQGPKKFEKQSRIKDSPFFVSVRETAIDNLQAFPRVFEASVFTPDRGEESNVNLHVVGLRGICIIGQDPSCLVTDSTRAPGKIFKTVEINGDLYKVRYTGPQAVLEKFSISPENPNAILPNGNIIITVLKDDQRFNLYTEVTYLTSTGSLTGFTTGVAGPHQSEGSPTDITRGTPFENLG